MRRVFLSLVFFLIAGFCYGAGKPESDYEKIRVLVDILEQVQTNYVEEIKLSELVYGAAHGIVRTLDPFSQFLPPDNLKEMRVETEGEFGGVGIRIAMGEDGWLTVISPLPGTPAFRMGVLPHDRIIKIDGVSTEGITIDKAVAKLRGKPGAKVMITIERDVNGENGAPTKKITKDLSLTREVIKIQTIYSRMINSTDIAHIRITEFNAKTPQDIHEALKTFSSQGMKALILDLRNNPGGLLSSAIETTKELLGDQKLIVYTQGRRPESRIEYRASSNASYASLPLVVLVNRGSASGSEILAGALQDNKRALLIGSRTFGKASVQSVINLPDGSGLRLTTGYYYTPNGRMIHRKEFARKKEEETPEADELEKTEIFVPALKKKPEEQKQEEGKDSEEKPKEPWGIDPDILVKVDPETEAKVQASFDVVYFPDKEAQPFQEVFKKEIEKKKEKQKAKDVEKKVEEEKEEKPVKDMVLERSVEVLKARKLFLNLQESVTQ